MNLPHLAVIHKGQPSPRVPWKQILCWKSRTVLSFGKFIELENMGHSSQFYGILKVFDQIAFNVVTKTILVF